MSKDSIVVLTHMAWAAIVVSAMSKDSIVVLTHMAWAAIVVSAH